MKQKILTLFCLICYTQSWAKDTKSTVPVFYPNYPVGNGGEASAPNVTTRLTGRVCLDFNGKNFIPRDSATYIYSSGRSGEVNQDMSDEYVKFDESIVYDFVDSTGLYIFLSKRRQTFDNLDKVETYLIQKWWEPGAIWKNQSGYHYWYDSDNKLKETTIDNWGGSAGWVSVEHFYNDFGNDGRIKTLEGGVYRIDIIYDNDGRIIEHTEQRKSNLGASFAYDLRTTYVYDNGFAPTEQQIEKWDGNNWVLYSLEEYTRAGTDLLETKTSMWSGSNWVLQQMLTYEYDANGNQISCVKKVWNGGQFENAKKQEWTYNSSHQPLTYYATSWNAAQDVWQPKVGDSALRFYYEKFDPTSIKSIANNAAISLYPVPAQDHVNATIIFDKAQQAEISVVDIMGRVVYQDQAPARKVMQVIVPVAELAAGQYVVRVTGSSQSAAKQFIIAR